MAKKRYILFFILIILVLTLAFTLYFSLNSLQKTQSFNKVETESNLWGISLKALHTLGIGEEKNSQKTQTQLPEVSLYDLNHDKFLTKKVYILPYVGDIDGEVSEDWFFFFDVITDFYEESKIPASFSFYPTSITQDDSFMKPFLKMYQSRYIELMQKEYIEQEIEDAIRKLPAETQIEIRENILIGEQEVFKKIIRQNGIKNPTLPISYTQLGGRITTNDREALERAGIKMYFDVYYDEIIGPIKSTPTFDVMQYGVSFTTDGGAGSETTFRSSSEIFESINSYTREDLEILTLNGVSVIPLWTHQQDFEDKDGKLNLKKWQIYRETLLLLKQDPNATFITPTGVSNFRHNSVLQKQNKEVLN